MKKMRDKQSYEDKLLDRDMAPGTKSKCTVWCNVINISIRRKIHVFLLSRYVMIRYVLD